MSKNQANSEKLFKTLQFCIALYRILHCMSLVTDAAGTESSGLVISDCRGTEHVK